MGRGRRGDGEGVEKYWIGVGEGGGKIICKTSFRLVSILFWVGGSMSGRWLEELELKPTLHLRVGQNVFCTIVCLEVLCVSLTLLLINGRHFELPYYHSMIFLKQIGKCLRPEPP